MYRKDESGKLYYEELDGTRVYKKRKGSYSNDTESSKTDSNELEQNGKGEEESSEDVGDDEEEEIYFKDKSGKLYYKE